MTTIYTNGNQLFTLENYDKTAGISELNQISIYDEVTKFTARAMHSTGSLFYIFGIGDRKFLNKQQDFKKNIKINNFEIR